MTQNSSPASRPSHRGSNRPVTAMQRKSWRLGVATTTKHCHTARSATRSRSCSRDRGASPACHPERSRKTLPSGGPTFRGRINSNPESRSRWIKAGGNGNRTSALRSLNAGLHVDHCFGLCLRGFGENPGRILKVLIPSLPDLVRVNAKILRQLDQCLLALDCGHRYCHFRLPCRAVVPAWASCHGFVLARSIMLTSRGKCSCLGSSDPPNHLTFALAA